MYVCACIYVYLIVPFTVIDTQKQSTIYVAIGKKKQRDYTLMKVKSVFFPYRNIYIYIKSNFDLRKTVLNTQEQSDVYIVGGKRQINYQFIPTDLFRGCPLIRGLYTKQVFRDELVVYLSFSSHKIQIYIYISCYCKNYGVKHVNPRVWWERGGGGIYIYIYIHTHILTHIHAYTYIYIRTLHTYIQYK